MYNMCIHFASQTCYYINNNKPHDKISLKVQNMYSTTTKELTLYSELKPYSPDDERLSEDTQRRHTHQADHKLEKRPRIQTRQDAGRKIDLIHPLPFA